MEQSEVAGTAPSLSRRNRREFLYYLSHGERMFQVVVRLSSRTGVIGPVLSLLNTRVWLTDFHAYDIGDSAIISGFVRKAPQGVTAESLEELVRLSPAVLDCKVTESTAGLLLDSFHTGIEDDYGEPLMLFRRDAVNRMFDRMVEVFGTGGEVMLQYEGEAIGEQNGKEIEERIGKQKVELNLKDAVRLLTVGGWGDASLSMSPEMNPVVRIENCFESSSGSGVRKGCHFVTGMITGASRAIFGPRATCRETRCVLRGDEYDEFALSPGLPEDDRQQDLQKPHIPA
ncbi:MAG: hypothetical protein JRN08_03070 [Nitrososphaerota archaeon]|nr:hypothetical protein [Nitrososphaerota archaeon]